MILPACSFPVASQPGMDAGVPLDLASPDLVARTDLHTGCQSGEFWNPNFAPGPEMFPGRVCIQCHVDENIATGEGDAPIFSFAGTVYRAIDEPNDCNGTAARGAEVEVTDARDRVFKATVNAQGNFNFTDGSFTYPLRARVLFQGRERRMMDPVKSGDCNACHTAAGFEGAPGRIILP